MTPRTLFWPLALSHSRISSQSHRHLPRNHSPTFPPSFTVAHSTSRSPLPHPSPHSHSTLHTSLSFLIYSFQILWKFLTVKVKLGAFMSMTLNALINHNGLFGFLSFSFPLIQVNWWTGLASQSTQISPPHAFSLLTLLFSHLFPLSSACLSLEIIYPYLKAMNVAVSTLSSKRLEWVIITILGTINYSFMDTDLCK